MDRDLTVGFAARICRVSCALVNKWCQSGMLKFYRLPSTRPNQKHTAKRIRAAELLRFLEQHAWPIDELCPGLREFAAGRIPYVRFASLVGF